MSGEAVKERVTAVPYIIQITYVLPFGVAIAYVLRSVLLTVRTKICQKR